jgi:hypothetical protein
MGQSSSLFRLAVWKPANPARRLMVSSSASSIDYQLHEQVYSWAPDEIDIWGSLKDQGQTNAVRAALVERFDPSRPVKDRSISHLGDALAVLRTILESPSATDWSECEEYVKTGDDDQVNLRANTILLLYRHLEWVWRIFAHVPGASVTVR